MTDFVDGETLTASDLNAAFATVTPPTSPLLGGSAGAFSSVAIGGALAISASTLNIGTIAADSLFGNPGTAAAVPGAVAIGSGISLSPAGTLSATGSGGTVTQVVSGAGLHAGTITATGTLLADWNGGTVSALGTGMSLVGGTLSATGSGGSVTQVVAGAGLAGGTISTTGTLSLGTRAASTIMGNPGTAAAVPSDVTIGTGLTLSTAGTLSATGGGGSVTSVVAGAGLNGGTITSAGTLTANWQGGTVATVGDGVGINSGTIQVDHQGTITLSGTTTGTITPAAGVASELVNVGTAAGTISVGAGLYAGQHLRVEILQGATAQTVAFDSTVEFGTDITSYTATAVASKRDLVQLIWNSSASKWMFAAVNHGFS